MASLVPLWWLGLSDRIWRAAAADVLSLLMSLLLVQKSCWMVGNCEGIP